VKVKKLILGYYNVNCYIVYSPDICFIIDPGADFASIEKYLEQEQLKVDFILNTHGHYDHIAAVPDIIKKYNIKFYIHKNDEEIITDPDKNFSSIFTQNPLSLKTYNLIDGKISDYFESLGIKTYNMPGHTPGSIVIETGNFLFTGDLLFRGGVGRTDLYGGDQGKLELSLSGLKEFSKNLMVFPGHGANSTLEYEFRNNYFLNGVYF
jgi:hydroxyacylglutathione hydrolase